MKLHGYRRYRRAVSRTSDSGERVTEADTDVLFDYGDTGSDDGTGVGLSIVSEVADAHGWP
jgi:signal transduction histidine kinase